MASGLQRVSVAGLSWRQAPGDVVLVEVYSETGNALGFVPVPVAKLELKR